MEPVRVKGDAAGRLVIPEEMRAALGLPIEVRLLR